MKLNKIFMALAAMAVVGCSSEDVTEFTATQAVEDSNLIELGSDFALAGVGEGDNVTRTHYENVGGNLVNKFLPIYNADAAADALLSVGADRETEAVGLCWLGQTPDSKVYTNYQFYHFGWLNIGETKENFECGDLTNGALYSDLKLMAAGTAGDEADPTNFAYATGTGTPADDLNFNTGIYKTDNKAIFGGDYIVYYPFNPDFKNAGTIPAKAETVFDNVSESFNTKELGRATFRYSRTVTIEGGDQAAGFGLHNLSKLVRLKVATPVGDALSSGTPKKFDQIVLYSPSKKLLKQANLAADKIVAGKDGSDLYESTEGTKTITANFTAAVDFVDVDNTPKSAFITVLPTNVDDLKVLVHNSSDGTWATVDLPTDFDTEDLAYTLNIIVKAADFKSEYIAVDEASLNTALTEAAGTTATIQVIGDITLSASTTINEPNITITGDAIIVPENVTLAINAIMESDIRVLGKSCCSGTTGGRLTVNGGTISNVTLEPTEAKVNSETDYNNYNPLVVYNTGATVATVAAGKTFDAKAGRIVVRKAVEHKGHINIAEGVTLKVEGTGDLNFMGSTVLNNGTIEVLKGGHFDITDKDGNATATDGQNMTNNGTFIHNVDAAVGTAVQKMNQKGEYRCRVDDQVKLDNAFLQWTACSVIEMVAAPTYGYDLKNAKQHNNDYIDIEVNAPAATTFENTGNDTKNIEIGSLTVNSELGVKFVTDKRTLTVHRDMNVNANTTLTTSKKIDVKGDVNVKGATLTYAGLNANKAGFAVAKNITVDAGTFDADAVNAINITCTDFTLKNASTAKFGNMTDGVSKSLIATGTIANPAGCTFDIHTANQDGNGSVIAWITCTKLTVGGAFPGGRPTIE